jgi:predicted nucleic acid-binding protein
MSAERFTLDTNVLVYAVDAREGLKSEMAQEIIALSARLDCPLALQAIGEFYVTAASKLKLTAKDAALRARQLMTGFETFAHSAQAVRAALDEAPKSRLSFWDGVLLASAAEAGCTTILSEAMADGTRFGSIVVLNPFTDNGLAPVARALLGL